MLCTYYLLILSLLDEQTWFWEGDAACHFLKLETQQGFIKSYIPGLWELVLSPMFYKADLLIAHGVPSLQLSLKSGILCKTMCTKALFIFYLVFSVLPNRTA